MKATKTTKTTKIETALVNGINLSEFEALICSLAYKTPTNNIIDTDDVKQELLTKLVESLPKFKGLTREETFGFAKKILHDKSVDLIRYYSTHSDTSIYNKETDTFQLDDVLVDSAQSLSQHFANPLQEMIKGDLVDLVLDWAEAKGEEAALFISELLEPSEWVKVRFEEMVDKFKPYGQYKTIPATTVGLILGMKPSDVSWYMGELKEFVREVGFAVK